MSSSFDEQLEAEVEVLRPATGGGVARMPDGRVVFVRGALVGERVRIAVREIGARFLRAEVLEVRDASAQRVRPPCPYARPGGCGGCDLQHADPIAQRDWTAALVSEHLRRIAHIERVVTVVPAPSPARGSRTRLRAAVDADGLLGLRRYRSHDVEPLTTCWLADERLGAAFSHPWPDAVEVELRALGSVPLAVVRHGDGTTSVRDLDGRPWRGSPVARVAVGDLHYEVSPTSFWQSHVDAPSILTQRVLAFADLDAGDRVVDLYSGVGLFALAVARVVGSRGRVVALESSPSAVRDARVNLEGSPRASVRASAVSPRSLGAAVEAGDVVILDPPRTGLGRGVAAALAGRDPSRLVYVSCDAATFARDVKEFLESGFSVGELEVHELFPMTEHVELVAVLDRSRTGRDSST